MIGLLSLVVTACPGDMYSFKASKFNLFKGINRPAWSWLPSYITTDLPDECRYAHKRYLAPTTNLHVTYQRELLILRLLATTSAERRSESMNQHKVSRYHVVTLSNQTTTRGYLIVIKYLPRTRIAPFNNILATWRHLLDAKGVINTPNRA